VPTAFDYLVVGAGFAGSVLAERLAAEADLAKLRANLGGVKNMQRVPDAMFVVDLKTEEIAVREAQRLRIPVIGLVDKLHASDAWKQTLTEKKWQDFYRSGDEAKAFFEAESTRITSVLAEIGLGQ